MGSRSWSQDVAEASENPVAGFNLVYALHFYATSHGESIRSKARQAISNGVALFASEWGVCKFSGGGDMEVNWSPADLSLSGTFIREYIQTNNVVKPEWWTTQHR